MITIVVADDEKVIRAGLKKILTDAMGVPLSIFEAKNGTEALEICKTEMPDIIITDIRMPQIDGVELMNALSTLPHHPAIIVLSGYDDFSYAQVAIKNGAVSYILKPVDKKELMNAVNEAVATSQKAERKRNEQTLKNIVEEGCLSSGIELQKYSFTNGLYCVTVSGMNCAELFSKALSPVEYYSIEQKKQHACFVVPRESLYLIQTDMMLQTLSVGISPVADSLSVLRVLCRQSFTAMLQSFFDEKNTIALKIKRSGIFYYQEQNALTDFTSIDQQYEKCVGKLSVASTEEVQQSVKTLFSFITVSDKNNAELLNHVYTKLINDLFIRFPGFSDTDMYLHLKGIMIENIWQFNTLSEWITCVNDYMVYLATLLKQNTKEYPYISEAVEYVKTHFTKNINMAMVANHVSVNYTWFSEKFKEHIGVNFNDYLKRLRIEEAERLLEQGCYKVYEVAERSGFGDVKYFMKIFRETTGISPTEWKKGHLNDK